MVLYFSVGGKGVILCDPEMETEVGDKRNFEILPQF